MRRLSKGLLGAAALALLAGTAAQARVTRIEITKQEPFAGGQSQDQPGHGQIERGADHSDRGGRSLSLFDDAAPAAGVAHHAGLLR